MRNDDLVFVFKSDCNGIGIGCIFVFDYLYAS